MFLASDLYVDVLVVVLVKGCNGARITDPVVRLGELQRCRLGAGNHVVLPVRRTWWPSIWVPTTY